jgi:hypothetical protein
MRYIGTGTLLALIAATCACSRSPDEEYFDGLARAERDVEGEVDTAPLRPTSEEMIALLRSSDGVLPPRFPGPGNYRLYNEEMVIPPQCYTKHESQFNPCYVCHQNHVPGRENRMNDGRLQLAYSFSEQGQTNHWKNLFEDRTERASAISDAAIRDWIDTDNFSELAARLEAVDFRGHIPKLDNLAAGPAAFDEEGFAKDGSHWVAFNYKPMPSTFWPTNGSTDDVMIRLPAEFRQDRAGQYSRDVYKANLALVEAGIKGFSAIGSLPIDEAKVGVDLDDDGMLSLATSVRRREKYVGAAEKFYVVANLYPRLTEFLHTVRYVGVAEDGEIYNAPRMKEVRYMIKQEFMTDMVLGHYYSNEYSEKAEGNLPQYPDHGQAGLDNKMGWRIQGFIEDKDGRLRFNTYEETAFCMGCHNSIGSTIDKTFGFPRKVDGAAGWGYIDLKGMPDAANVGEEQGEILTYLQRVGGGTEFRNNPEMESRWYRADGTVDVEAVRAAPDVHTLITPSAERALLLNKAYKTIVEDQDYIYGRDATVEPPRNVYEFVDNEDAPVLPAERYVNWDIRLDWGARDASHRVSDLGGAATTRTATPALPPSAEARRQLQLTLEQETARDLVEHVD